MKIGSPQRPPEEQQFEREWQGKGDTEAGCSAQLRKEEGWARKQLRRSREKQPQAEKTWSAVFNIQRQARRIDNGDGGGGGGNIRPSIRKTLYNLPETKHRNEQAFQRRLRATWPVFSYFPLVLLLGFSLLALKEPELENIPKGLCITVQNQWKMT